MTFSQAVIACIEDESKRETLRNILIALVTSQEMKLLGFEDTILSKN